MVIYDELHITHAHVIAVKYLNIGIYKIKSENLPYLICHIYSPFQSQIIYICEALFFCTSTPL